VYLNSKIIKNTMQIQNCIFIKVVNPLLNINFMVVKLCACTHNLAVSVNFLIAILTKHIFIA